MQIIVAALIACSQQRLGISRPAVCMALSTAVGDETVSLCQGLTSEAGWSASTRPGCRICAVYSRMGLPPVSGGSCHRSCSESSKTG